MKRILTVIALFLIILPVAAETGLSDISPIFNIDNKVVSAITFESLSNAVKKVNLNSENYLEGIQNATERYTQTNVVAAYKDFLNIINSINGKNDFLYVTMAQRLDSLGFFTLSQNSLINIKDTELWHKSLSTLKKLYLPAVTLTYDEEIYLTGLQTATLYNNSAKETIKELEKNDKILKKSDYANYILAVAYFENKNYSKALNAINKAIAKAPDCINYLHFKSKIYTQTNNYKAALNIINNIEKEKLISNYYRDYLNNDKLYILMKTSKKDKEKLYSAELLFQKGDYQKALKDAQLAISMNKKNLDAYCLIGDYYIKINEPEKAKEYYMKAYNIKQKYAPALLGMGHYYYVTKDYISALDYYKRAYRQSAQNEQILLSIANCLIQQKDNLQASEYLKKVIKINPNSDSAYYMLSKITPEMNEQYLRTAISLNPVNEYAWIDLTELKINQRNFKEAREYLFPIALINPNNPKYRIYKNIIENRLSLKSTFNIEKDFLNVLINTIL